MSPYVQLVIGCERSGIVRGYFRGLGVNAWSCDLADSEDDSPFHYKGDALAFMRANPQAGKIIHPPCTRMANSGALRLYVNGKKCNGIDPLKWRELELGARFFRDCWDIAIESGKPFAMENPIQHKHAIQLHGCGKQDQIVQPYEFGDDASKATALWLHGLPELIALPNSEQFPPRIINGLPRWGNQTNSGQNKLGPSDHRAIDRARTYKGIAKAMARQWAPYFINL